MCLSIVRVPFIDWLRYKLQIDDGLMPDQTTEANNLYQELQSIRGPFIYWQFAPKGQFANFGLPKTYKDFTSLNLLKSTFYIAKHHKHASIDVIQQVTNKIKRLSSCQEHIDCQRCLKIISHEIDSQNFIESNIQKYDMKKSDARKLFGEEKIVAKVCSRNNLNYGDFIFTIKTKLEKQDNLNMNEFSENFVTMVKNHQTCTCNCANPKWRIIEDSRFYPVFDKLVGILTRSKVPNNFHSFNFTE